MRSRRRPARSTAGLARPAVLLVDRHGWTSIVVRGELDDAQTDVMTQVLGTVLRSPAARAGRLLVDLQGVTRCSSAALRLVASLVARGVAIEARPVVAGAGPIASERRSAERAADDGRRSAAGSGAG
jgi:anti-anti-sigma regulatory factor